MLDRRFPYLLAPEDAPLDAERRGALASFAAAVLERTGCRVLFDSRGGSLFVHLAHDITQGLALPPNLTMLRHRSGWDWSILDKVDELCAKIRSGRVSWHIRDWMDGLRSRSVAHAEREAAQRDAADMSSEIKSMYDHVNGRKGMGSKFRRRAIVDGFKGRVLT